MNEYKAIGIDLAKRKFHLAAMNQENKVVLKKAMSRDRFFESLPCLFSKPEVFVMEACSGAHYTAQVLTSLGHQAILLKPKDVKAYAKSRQKNDINDAIAICKAACAPDLMRVKAKTKEDQEIAYLHKSRQNAIQQRIQRSNSLMHSLFEFGYLVPCGKSKFASQCLEAVKRAFEEGFISLITYKQMTLDCKEIHQFLMREKALDKEIDQRNKDCARAKLLQTIPGIGPIKASLLSIKSVDLYPSAKDFAASLGLVPKQHTTGGKIILGSIITLAFKY